MDDIGQAPTAPRNERRINARRAHAVTAGDDFLRALLTRNQHDHFLTEPEREEAETTRGLLAEWRQECD